MFDDGLNLINIISPLVLDSNQPCFNRRNVEAVGMLKLSEYYRENMTCHNSIKAFG